MTPETLEALRYKAEREDTPIDEARNCALQYVRNGGKISWAPVDSRGNRI